jgi:DNA invertase Pin-like site-specific DNA recombinase
MASADLLPAAMLKRKAVVYIRQSTRAQVQSNLESRRRQYERVDVARQRGFRDIEVIEDDPGRSASGATRLRTARRLAVRRRGRRRAVLRRLPARPQRPRLASPARAVRAGRCPGDRPGRGLRPLPTERPAAARHEGQGSISEFELGVLRARMRDAARAKARRGELRISYIRHREIGLGFDPDRRIQEVVRLIFARFCQLGSARPVLLSTRAEGSHFPRPCDGKKLITFDWTPIRYRNVIAVLKNPFYAGVYAYGKGEKRTAIVDGRARPSGDTGKPAANNGASLNWSCSRRGMKPRSRNGAMPPAIPTIA